MTTDQMRNAIKPVYETSSWRNRVDYMPDEQVIAVYYNFLHRGILNKVMKKERPVITDTVEPTETYQQMSFFDLAN